MMRKLLLLFAISLCACGTDDDASNSSCDSLVIVDEELYENSMASVQISEAVILENCLLITYSSSGCDDSNWDEKLIDASIMAESNPVQRYLKLTINNTELCQAWFTKEKSFDLTPIQIENRNEILIYIDSMEEPILYRY